MKKAPSKKSNKKIIAIISAIIAVVVAGTVATVFAININRNNEEYTEQSEIYDNYTEIAGKVNDFISDSEKKAEEATSQDTGDDKSKIEELNRQKAEILTYKIEIPENKASSLDTIRGDNEKLLEALNKVDENLANLSSEEIEEYQIAKDSKIGILSEKISSLIQEIEAQARAYAERKAQEEAKQKILNGDLSAFKGTYEDSGYKVVVKSDGFYLSNGSRVFKTADMTIKQGGNGSYIFETKPKSVTSVTGYTMSTTNSFTISADGKSMEFSDGENLGAYRLVKIN